MHMQEARSILDAKRAIRKKHRRRGKDRKRGIHFTASPNTSETMSAFACVKAVNGMAGGHDLTST
jgi:hypothetical protein